MTIRPLLLLVLLAAPGLSACRSDGYAGHRTSRQSSAWALEIVGGRFTENADRCAAMLGDAGPALSRNISNGLEGIQRTWSLYRFGTPSSPDPTLTNRKHSDVHAPPDDGVSPDS